MNYLKKEVTRDEFIKKRVERQRKIRKRRIIAFFIFFIIILLIVALTLCFTVFFPIENISVKGSKIYSSSEILKKSDIVKGDNLFAVSKAKTENKLKAKLPYIESIDFKRELTGDLTITVKDAQEFACYIVDEVFYTVSASGWVLEKNIEKPENLLLINAPNIKCKVGSEADFSEDSQKELVESIISILKTEEINTNVIDVTNNLEINLRVENRFEVNLGTSNNIEEKIKCLGAMVEKISEDEQGKINLSMWTNDNKNGTFIAEKQ